MGVRFVLLIHRYLENTHRDYCKYGGGERRSGEVQVESGELYSTTAIESVTARLNTFIAIYDLAEPSIYYRLVKTWS
jgi:hypothetical protein